MKDPKQQILYVISKLMLKQKLNTGRPEIFPSPVKSSEMGRRKKKKEDTFLLKLLF